MIVIKLKIILESLIESFGDLEQPLVLYSIALHCIAIVLYCFCIFFSQNNEMHIRAELSCLAVGMFVFHS